MKALFLSTALVALTAAPALADAHKTTTMTTTALSEMAADWGGELTAASLIGKRLYVAETPVAAEPRTQVGEDWTDVGNVGDVLIGNDGTLFAVLLEIGGFLGIGDKTIAVELDQLNLVQNSEDGDAYFVVFNGDQTMLEQAEELDLARRSEFVTEPNNEVLLLSERGMTVAEAEVEVESVQPQMEATESLLSGDTTTADPLTEAELTRGIALSGAAEEGDIAEDAQVLETVEVATADGDAGALDQTGPQIAGPGWTMVDMMTLSADALEGAYVYDANDDRVGEVSQILLDQNGGAIEAVVDLGGFLGFGEKPVAIKVSEMQVVQETGGYDLRVYVDATEEQLEGMPTWTE